MLFSKATGYSVRAMVYLASQPKDQLCGLKQIAEREQIPPVFLRKVLGKLSRKRLLLSIKGIHGGYRLARPPESVTVWDVIRSLEADLDFEYCILGSGICNTEKPCPLHSSWERSRDALMTAWKLKTLSELASQQQPSSPIAPECSQGADGREIQNVESQRFW